MDEFPYGVRFRFSGQWETVARFNSQINAERFCQAICDITDYQMYKVNNDGTISEFVDNHLLL